MGSSLRYTGKEAANTYVLYSSYSLPYVLPMYKSEQLHTIQYSYTTKYAIEMTDPGARNGLKDLPRENLVIEVSNRFHCIVDILGFRFYNIWCSFSSEASSQCSSSMETNISNYCQPCIESVH